MNPTDMSRGGNEPTDLQKRVHEIIFEADTPAGKQFDVLLIICILLSVGATMIETIPGIHPNQRDLLNTLEWAFTIGFTLEYFVRLWCVKSPRMYATSFWGVIDLLAILPSYLGLVFQGAEVMLMIRFVRVLRVFRILGMNSYVTGLNKIAEALKRNSKKISVFLTAILILVTIFGSLMFVIEGQPVKVKDRQELKVDDRIWIGKYPDSKDARVTTASEVEVMVTLSGESEANRLADDEEVYRPFNEQFDSIPKGVYWAIVTLTTVGYGDISPITPQGQFIAAMVMILGYSILGVAIGGIVSTEMSGAGSQTDPFEIKCLECDAKGHAYGARRCYVCGAELPVPGGSQRDINTARSCINCGAEGHRLEAQFCHNCGEPLDAAGVDAYKELFSMDLDSDVDKKDDKDS